MRKKIIISTISGLFLITGILAAGNSTQPARDDPDTDSEQISETHTHGFTNGFTDDRAEPESPVTSTDGHNPGARPNNVANTTSAGPEPDRDAAESATDNYACCLMVTISNTGLCSPKKRKHNPSSFK